MELDPKYAVPLWVGLGGAAGLLAWRLTRERGPVPLMLYGICGLLGALAGGVLTLVFTAGRPESGGFYTSLVTSAVGSALALGLCKAALDDSGDAKPDSDRTDQPAPGTDDG
jgi:uncharacterized membrane protein YeaQ/YmgE (transglycosylase-associated protein family)